MRSYSTAASTLMTGSATAAIVAERPRACGSSFAT